MEIIYVQSEAELKINRQTPMCPLLLCFFTPDGSVFKFETRVENLLSCQKLDEKINTIVMFLP